MGTAHIPSRTFTGSTENTTAAGTATIDQINSDQDEQNIMLNPDGVHVNGDRGGIHKGNLMTDSEGNNDSGIITDDTIEYSGNAATATNVTTSINGNAITDIFENDGTTVKNATLANAAIGDTRFQLSGVVGSVRSVASITAIEVQRIIRTVPDGKSLIIKHACYSINAFLRLRVVFGSGTWTSSVIQDDDYDSHLVYTNNTGLPATTIISILLYNTDPSSRNCAISDSWWLDLSIE